MTRRRSEVINGSRVVRDFFKIVDEQHESLKKVSELTGINRNTMTSWRNRTMPKVDTIEAALNVVGYTMIIKRIGE
jgi:hypothetical protein